MVLVRSLLWYRTEPQGCELAAPERTNRKLSSIKSICAASSHKLYTLSAYRNSTSQDCPTGGGEGSFLGHKDPPRRLHWGKEGPFQGGAFSRIKITPGRKSPGGELSLFTRSRTAHVVLVVYSSGIFPTNFPAHDGRTRYQADSRRNSRYRHKNEYRFP